MHNLLRPQPAPPAFAQGKVVPEVTSSPLSRLFFEWLSPFLSVGFSRPLETDGVYIRIYVANTINFQFNVKRSLGITLRATDKQPDGRGRV